MSPSLLAALVCAIGLIVACRGDAPPADGLRLVEAPIVEVTVVPPSTLPARYGLRVVSALPDGCHAYHDAAIARHDAVVDVTVRNAIPARDDLACTMVYGTVEHTIDLGAHFTPGVAYTVRVNGHVTVFTAR
ncbi:MAG: hypothetical protein EXR65_04335 [Dehalococcoidia bacterium]|nr:hypothetical protein [Dehalococcoidia bacterium]